MMFSGYAHSPDSDAQDSNLHFGMMIGELWHDWFEAASELAYRTHRACEFLAENDVMSNGRYSSFNARPPRGPFAGRDNSIDLEKLEQCLQSMDADQAARVMHAVQFMQAMEAMAARRKRRANEEEAAPW
jgi:hypothetical protein